jgi:hypothetical protein
MRPLRRLVHILFAASAALSSVVLVAVVALWVRSHHVTDGWAWSDGVQVPTAGYRISWRKMLLSRKGKVYFIADRNMGGATPYSRRLDSEQAQATYQFNYLMLPMSNRPTLERRFLGFERLTYSGYPMIASTMIGPPVELTRIWAVPYWPAVLAATVLPAWWWAKAWRRTRQARRVRQGLCARCGYDLRASRGACPECGLLPAAMTPQSP